MSTHIEQIGRRHYLRNLPFAAKDAAKAAGCKWDPEQRAWWSSNAQTAAEITAKAEQAPAAAATAPAERKAPGMEGVVAGKAEYKGKTYYLAGRIIRGRTQWDDSVSTITTRDGAKILLYSRDGTLEFWAALEAVKITKSYQRSQTIGGLKDFALRAKRDEAEGRDTGWKGNGCSACRQLDDWCPQCAFDEFDN